MLYLLDHDAPQEKPIAFLIQAAKSIEESCVHSFRPCNTVDIVIQVGGEGECQLFI